MKAAVMRAIGEPLRIEDIRIDTPGPREVLVRTAAVGVCHSDLHILEGDELAHGSYPRRHSPGTMATVLTSWPAVSLSRVQLMASCTVLVG